ncbi:MAG TPA: hypothetical protein VGO00_16010, partial [Kofleriaceae bacterium]|nr:hypothetical protein [Kofleriaceae bacterium]
FTIDASSWQIDPDMTTAMLKMSCSAAPSVCDTAAQQACTMGCSGTCSMATETCDLKLAVSLYQPVNLLMEKPDLKTVTDQSVLKVSIDNVTYEVTSNSLNVATPKMLLFIAPMSVMDPNDPMAKEIGEIDPVQAGATTSGPQPIAFTDTGKADLQAIMATFKTPFNVIIGSTLEVTSGDPVPMGKLDAVVHIVAHAGL